VETAPSAGGNPAGAFQHPAAVWDFRRVFLATLTALAVAAVFVGAYAFRQVLSAVLMAWMLAIVLRPAVDALAGRRLPRALAVLLVMTALLAVAAAAVWLLAPRAVRSIEASAAQVPLWLDRARDWLVSSDSRLARYAGRALTGWSAHRSAAPRLGSMGMSGTDVLNRLASGALYLIATGVMAAYLSVDRTAFRRAVALVLPESRRERVSEFLDDVESRLGAYVRGQLVVCLAVGVLTGVAYALLGMPHPLLLGGLAGALEIVPVLGPVLAAVPAVLVAMKLDGGGMVLGVLGVAATVQILESYVISPLVLCRRCGMSPLGLILAVLGFSVLLGPAGAIVAIPAAVVLQLCFERFVLDRDAAINPQVAGGRDRWSALQVEARGLSHRLRRWHQADHPVKTEGNEALVDELEAIATGLARRIGEQRERRRRRRS
jgi:predicted PurR-regulated permease PerM